LVGGEGFAVDASLIVADANKQRSVPGSEWNKTRDPDGASRAMQEYLATLEDAAFGAASEVTPKFVSPSDPAAQWTGAMRGPAFFAYANNYLIDVKFGIAPRISGTWETCSFHAAATEQGPSIPLQLSGALWPLFTGGQEIVAVDHKLPPSMLWNFHEWAVVVESANPADPIGPNDRSACAPFGL
jgi:hypothetical protein